MAVVLLLLFLTLLLVALTCSVHQVDVDVDWHVVTIVVLVVKLILTVAAVWLLTEKGPPLVGLRRHLLVLLLSSAAAHKLDAIDGEVDFRSDVTNYTRQVLHDVAWHLAILSCYLLRKTLCLSLGLHVGEAALVLGLAARARAIVLTSIVDRKIEG